MTVIRAVTEPDTKTPTGATISSTPTAGTVAVLTAFFAGVPLAIATGKFVTFNQARQHAIEEAYRNGKPIPYNISRRLKGSFLPRH